MDFPCSFPCRHYLWCQALQPCFLFLPSPDPSILLLSLRLHLKNLSPASEHPLQLPDPAQPVVSPENIMIVSNICNYEETSDGEQWETYLECGPKCSPGFPSSPGEVGQGHCKVQHILSLRWKGWWWGPGHPVNHHHIIIIRNH